MSIASFRHKGLQELYVNGTSKLIGPSFHKAARRILDTLNYARSPGDLIGTRAFHPLTGDRKGTYAMKVSRNYRITFRWQNDSAVDVDFEDYH
jgi:proteic killer suppression protein